MTKEQLYSGLKATFNIPIAYHHFDNPPTIPFIAYIDVKKDRFKADNIVYYKDAKYRIEIYYENTDGNLEEQMENFLDSIETVWEDEEPIYIQEEKLYLKTYYI